jgi:hypothetical protein
MEAYFQILEYIPKTQNIKSLATITMEIYQTMAVEYWVSKVSLAARSICPLRKKDIIKEEKIINISKKTCANILKLKFLFMRLL